MARTAALGFALLLAAGCNNATPPTAPDAEPVMAGTPGVVVPMASGVTRQLRRTDHDVTGSARVSVENGVGVIELSDDFSVAQTPGPYLYLNTTNNPNTGQPLRIANLRGKSGAQRFTFSVPPGVRYTWLVIWCDPFNVPMAEASLLPTP